MGDSFFFILLGRSRPTPSSKPHRLKESDNDVRGRQISALAQYDIFQFVHTYRAHTACQFSSRLRICLSQNF